MVVIYMHNSVKVCGPTTMKPTFYKPVLVLFLGGYRNVISFSRTKQNKDGLQSCFANTAHITSTQAECKKSLAVNLHFNFFQWHLSESINCVTNQVEIRIGLFLEWGYGDFRLLLRTYFFWFSMKAMTAPRLPRSICRA